MISTSMNRNLAIKTAVKDTVSKMKTCHITHRTDETQGQKLTTVTHRYQKKLINCITTLRLMFLNRFFIEEIQSWPIE